MKDNELLASWKAYDQKIEKILSVNEVIVAEITRRKFLRTLGVMRTPKFVALIIGVPYVIILFTLSLLGYQAGAPFVTVGFGAMAMIMAMVVVAYCYHLILISQINLSDDIIQVQSKLSHLKIASFNCVRLAILQLPFWVLCWMSLEALQNSPWLYGGVNLAIFLSFVYLSYVLYKNLSIDKPASKISRFFLSGSGWEPIVKAGVIREQLKEYQGE